MKFSHNPIMVAECMDALAVKQDGIYVDCTAGGGGHSQAILDRLGESGRLIDIDRDTEALNACKQRFEGKSNVTFVKSNYKDICNVLDSLGIDKVDGIMADLGISSYQIDNPERGFSYMERSAPLDMRMDQTVGITAKDVVNTYDERELYEILKDYGEEEFAKVIASNIVKQRQTKSFETCGDLVDVTDKSIPQAVKRKRGHSAKKTFQALRIEVNKELDGLDKALRDMVSRLNPNGRLVILTFHSLEDRIVKRCFNDCQTDCICPPSAPICVCNHRAVGKLVNKKPIVPSAQEQQENSRSCSCKLRALEKL